jgi:uncharacterized membrane protein
MKSETHEARASAPTARAIPFDLAIMLVATVGGAYAILTVLPSRELVRFAIGAPLLFFFPGYGLLSALFPRRALEGDMGWEPLRSSPRSRSPAPGERAILSFGLSLLLVPIVIAPLGLLSPGLTQKTVLGAIVGLVVLTGLVGLGRRLQLPAEERFTVWDGGWAAAFRDHFAASSTAKSLATVVLIVAVVAAGSSVVYAIAAPQPTEDFTEFALYQENESGELVISQFPDNVTKGTAVPLVSSVENHGGEATNYTVVVQLQRVNDSGTVLERRELTRYGARVGAGETWNHEHVVAPSLTGENLRVVYLLYEGEPPEKPRASNALRHLHFWVTVTPP